MSAVILWAWDEDNKVYRKVLVDDSGKLKISDADPFELVQNDPNALRHAPYGHCAAIPAWKPLAVDADGKLQITLSNLATLNSIDDVYVPSPTDEYFLYWDAPNSRWACRALVAADMAAHKNTHDPIDGSDKLDTNTPVKVGSANAIGSSHSLARADHVHEREHAKYTDAEAVDAIEADGNLPVAGIIFIIDGGGAAITTGEKGHLRIPFACTINEVTMLADRDGAIVVDIWKDTYDNFPPTDGDSITSATPPTITATTRKSTDSTLTGWTTAIGAGAILAFNVDSVATIERVTIALKVTKS